LAIEGCVDMVAACTGAIERASNQSEPVGEEARDCNVRAEQKRVRMSKLTAHRSVGVFVRVAL
jgi:hypothetical protein